MAGSEALGVRGRAGPTLVYKALVRPLGISVVPTACAVWIGSESGFKFSWQGVYVVGRREGLSWVLVAPNNAR